MLGEIARATRRHRFPLRSVDRWSRFFRTASQLPLALRCPEWQPVLAACERMASVSISEPAPSSSRRSCAMIVRCIAVSVEAAPRAKFTNILTTALGSPAVPPSFRLLEIRPSWTRVQSLRTAPIDSPRAQFVTASRPGQGLPNTSEITILVEAPKSEGSERRAAGHLCRFVLTFMGSSVTRRKAS
jgi:hypothetical protein